MVDKGIDALKVHLKITCTLKAITALVNEALSRPSLSPGPRQAIIKEFFRLESASIP